MVGTFRDYPTIQAVKQAVYPYSYIHNTFPPFYMHHKIQENTCFYPPPIAANTIKSTLFTTIFSRFHTVMPFIVQKAEFNIAYLLHTLFTYFFGIFYIKCGKNTSFLTQK